MSSTVSRRLRHTVAARALFVAAAILLLALPLVAGCSAPRLEHDARRAADRGSHILRGGTNSAAGGGVTVSVERSIDGDTFDVAPAIDGIARIRLIGVDTPESAIPGEKPQPFGKKAAAFTADRLEGRRVALTFDKDRKDPYGRVLAYARRPGASITYNELLVRRGLAQVAIFEPDDRLAPKLYAAQKSARSRGVGIWSLSHSRQCLLTDRGNQVGAGSAGC